MIKMYWDMIMHSVRLLIIFPIILQILVVFTDTAEQFVVASRSLPEWWLLT